VMEDKPFVACLDCKLRARCQKLSDHCCKSLAAWADGFSMDCQEYQPRWNHGVEGVIDHPRAPFSAGSAISNRGVKCH